MFTAIGEAAARLDGELMSKLVKDSGLYAFVAMMVLTITSCSRSQSPTAPQVLDKPAPNSWQARAQKLAVIRKTATGEVTDADKLLLISWLDHDAGVVPQFDAKERTADEADEGYGNYITELSIAVAALKDKRALPALVRVMNISEGICTAIAEFGDDAVDLVIASLTNPDLDMRLGAVDTLGFLLKGQQLRKNSLSSQSADHIQAELVKTARDPDPLIREQAVQSLAFAKPSAEAVDLVKKLSTDDPAEWVRTTDGAPRTVYPIREQAAATLKAWAQ
jgi:hypothetical protein